MYCSFHHRHNCLMIIEISQGSLAWTCSVNFRYEGSPCSAEKIRLAVLVISEVETRKKFTAI